MWILGRIYFYLLSFYLFFFLLSFTWKNQESNRHDCMTCMAGRHSLGCSCDTLTSSLVVLLLLLLLLVILLLLLLCCCNCFGCWCSWFCCCCYCCWCNYFSCCNSFCCCCYVVVFVLSFINAVVFVVVKVCFFNDNSFVSFVFLFVYVK